MWKNLNLEPVVMQSTTTEFEPTIKHILEQILDQNQRVLEMNKQIIAVLSRPVFIMRTKPMGEPEPK